jgi:hypothetical protein
VLCLFTFCTVHVSALAIVLSDSPYEGIRKWDTCPSFLRGHIIGLHLGGASMTETATLLGVSRMTVSEFTSAFTKHGRQHQQRETVGKN